jgi:hypothetical protein
VIQAVEDLGKLDNTLIIYIEGDNGTSAEGTMVGTPNEMASLQGVTFPVADQLKFYDVWGSSKTYPHMAVPWAWAFDTPFTEGGRFGGYGLYLLKGKPVFLYNLLDLERFRWEGQEALAPGKHTIEFDFTYEGPGFGKGGTGVLKVDDKEVDNKKMPHTNPSIVPFDETFDIGLDTRTPVDDNDYRVPFHFTGKIAKLTFKLQPEQLTEEDRKVMNQYVIRGKD